MFRVTDNLYIAHWPGMQEVVEASELPPNAFIVNCTPKLPMLGDGIRVEVEDDGRVESLEAMDAALPSAVERIHEELARGRDVLVHCQAGRQRSATVICAYLIRYRDMSLDDAVATLKSAKRDVFFPSNNFRLSLYRFAYQVMEKS